MNFFNNFKNLNILCVEDDNGVRKRLVNTLNFYFNTVNEASNGQDAYEIYKKGNTDILITDIDMPKLNGIDLVKKIREENSEIPIIVLTAYSNEDYLMELINQNINHFILKPVNSKKLLDALNNVTKDIFPTIIKLSKDLIINFDTMEISYENKITRITNREKLFLKLLYKNQNRISTYKQINDFVWENDDMSNSALKTFIKVLRKKLNFEIIENISGVGYRFCY